MPLFLVHTAILFWTSFVTARSLVRSTAEQIITLILLAWANLVVTSLLLSCVNHLGDPAWFFRTSLLLALVTWLGLRRIRSESMDAPEVQAEHPHRWLLIVFVATLLPLFYAGIRIGVTYQPNNYDSLTYHLPRAMYYMGQNNLAHFDTGNPRQTYFPFNYNLLQLFCLIYGESVKTVNFINLILWAVSGLAIYRICRLSAFNVNASLVACWMALTSTQILAQATTTTNDLPTGAALLCAVVFALRWRQNKRARDALMSGVATGLAIGAKLTVVFFFPALGLLVLYWAWQHWQRKDLRSFFLDVRAWLVPGLLAFLFAAPFALINLAEEGQWINHDYDFTLNRPFSVGCAIQTGEAYLVQLFIEPLHRFTYDLSVTAALNAWGTRTFFPHWNAAYAFSPLYLFPPDLNEDHVWFGFTGPLIFLAAIFCLARCRRCQLPTAWLAWAGLGWFATYFLLNKWSLYNQRYFVPAILIMSPALAAIVEAGWANPRFRRGTRNIFVILAACALWLAGIYLFRNTSRPYAPLWEGDQPPPALPSLPPTMVRRLAGEPRINIDSTDGNERVFLLMTLGHNQRFTSSFTTDPNAYNVFSEWGFVRKVAYSNIEQLSSYTIVNVPAKRTAGVEFLGTIGSGQPAEDYYGLVPHPENAPSTADNRNVLVELSYGPHDPDRYAKLRIKVAGLNTPDHARLLVGVDYNDGTSETLATFTTTGEAPASVTRPFRRFTVRVVSEDNGRSLGHVEIPYFFRDQPPEIEAPQNPLALFSDELVTAVPKTRIISRGLAAPEGPYPQWNLPVIRWVKAPVLRLDIPAEPHLSRLDLSFELCLHVRESAHIDVLLNGEIVASYPWEGSTRWLIQDLSLRPKPGLNVIEFRNVTVGTEPDWLDYLARYPDVKNYVLSQHIPLERGAKEHYETFGRKENRTLYLKRQIATLPGPDQLYYLFRSLRIEGFRQP